MPTLRLTARGVQSMHIPASGRVEYWDSVTKGLGLRVSESGGKTFTIMYRHKGRLRRLTLGRYPDLSLADARELAKKHLRDAALGGDPAGQKRAARQAGTFAELAEEYMRDHAMRYKRSWKQDRRALDRDLLPRFGPRKANSVTRAEIRAMMREIRDRGASVLANRTLEIARRIFTWGIKEDVGDLDANPCRDIDRYPESSRDRVLSDDEVRQVWKAFDENGLLMGSLFKLRLVTAQRGGEVLRMRWPDVDMKTGWWVIPREHSKNKLSHRVPLSDLAMAILRELQPVTGTGEWVFPGDGDGPLHHFSKAMVRFKSRSGVTFKAHDLRRTAATRMTGDLSVDRFIVQRVLGHVEGSQAIATYDRASYDSAKRVALDAWAQRVREIIGDERATTNVVKLATPR